MKVAHPLQAYFRINAENFGQFERTLIIADEGSEVTYMEGCTAPKFSTSTLHSAVVELVALKGAKIQYITVQNWANNVFNLVTKRGLAHDEAEIKWIDCNIGSRLTMKYPGVVLKGRKARGEVISIALANDGQHQDTGAKMIHAADETTSNIVAKSISVGQGRSTYRGMVHIPRHLKGCRNNTECDALLINTNSRTDTYPAITVRGAENSVQHEASVSKVSEEQILYMRQRGLTEGQAMSLAVNGFVNDLASQFPMEYSVELKRLIDLEMEGSRRVTQSMTSPASAAAASGFTPELFALALAAQAGAPDWWIERKRAAFERFAALPMPKRTDESWRFSTVSGIRLDGFHPPSPSGRGKGRYPTTDALMAMPLSGSIGFLNHRVSSPASLASELKALGVVLTTIREALGTHGDVLKEHFMAQPQKLGSEKFASLHAAFVDDGAFIFVPRGVEIPHPILVVHAAAGAGAAVFPHTLVVAEEQSSVTVIDAFTSASSVSAAGDRGQRPLCRPRGPDFLRRHAGLVPRDAVVPAQLDRRPPRRPRPVAERAPGRPAGPPRVDEPAPGAGRLLRDAGPHGRGGQPGIRPAHAPAAPGAQHEVRPLCTRTRSSTSAKTIFSGLIIVDPDAQKTDAYQSNRNLVLSDDAEANSLPGLEIQANDVRCTHGATTSRIDAEQEFYLKSRGLRRPRPANCSSSDSSRRS